MYNASYKEAKEKFVAGHGGCSIDLISLILLTCPIGYLFQRMVLRRLHVYKNAYYKFILDYIAFCFPVLIVGIAHKFILVVYGVMLLLSAIFWYLNKTDVVERKTILKNLNATQKFFIKYGRTYVMYLTCIAILAVDFRVFPRYFAKAETTGVGLMDFGVGSFVYGAAIVSRLARGKVFEKRSTAVKTAILSAIPLLVLGFVRLAMVKLSNYPEHESEYGRHWNFFFTMAFLSLAVAAINMSTNVLTLGAMGLGLGVAYQCALTFLGVEAYVFGPDRSNLFAQNKEGIFSLFGYLSLFLLASCLGSIYHSNRTYHNWWTTLIGMCSFAGILRLARPFIHRFMLPSRRLVNLPYILDCLMINIQPECGLLLIDLISSSDDVNNTIAALMGGRHFPFVNNQTLIFLVANLATGAINISLDTMNAPAWLGMLIMFLYSVFIVVALHLLGYFKFQVNKHKQA